MNRLLDIQGAQKSFRTPEGGTVAALGGVDIDVGPNEFVTLLGPSGCGKTTLLRAVSGFDQLDAGRIVLDGEDLRAKPPFRRPVNTVFQSYALFSHMSVARNVGYSLEVAGVSKQERDRRIGDMLDMVGLSGMGARKPSQLSGGQRQRVALARAIIARPKLLLLDEPLSALDRRLRQHMQIELKSLQNELGIAFVFVTHDQEEALSMSDRIVVMREGRVEQTGTPREIFRKPRTQFVAEFIGDTNLFEVTLRGKDGCRMRAETKDGIVIWFTEVTALKAGEKTTLVLRPTDLSFSSSDGHARFKAQVRDRVYLGMDLHYYVRPENGDQDVLVIVRADGTRRDVGEDLNVFYDPARTHIVEGS